MRQPAAKKGDAMTAIDLHILVLPTGTTAPVPFPFVGEINGKLSANVNIMGKPAATAGSTAANKPEHMAPPGTSFQTPPSNEGKVQRGSQTVRINGEPAARSGDIVETCRDIPTAPGVVVASGTVLIG